MQSVSFCKHSLFCTHELYHYFSLSGLRFRWKSIETGFYRGGRVGRHATRNTWNLPSNQRGKPSPQPPPLLTATPFNRPSPLPALAHLHRR